MPKVLRYTMVVRHPGTLAATALVAGSEVPEWAGGLVHDDDLEDAKPAAPVAPSTETDDSSDEPTDDDETPSKEWTNGRIRKYAVDNGIDLGEATTKDDMLAVIHG